MHVRNAVSSVMAMILTVLLLLSACEHNAVNEPVVMEKPPADETIVNPDDFMENRDTDDSRPGSCHLNAGLRSSAVSNRLQITCIAIDGGFRIEELSDSIASMQTFVSPEIGRTRYAVHVLRSYGPEYIMRNEALIVDPAKKEYRMFPMFEVPVNDGNDQYHFSSVADAFGFTDEGRLVYVKPGYKDDQISYVLHVSALDIAAGDIIELAVIDNVRAGVSFSASWMTSDKQKLVLNNQAGQLWVVDLPSGTIDYRDQLFRHPWPFSAADPSPDGQLVWYADYYAEEGTYQLYDLELNLLRTLPFSEGFNTYPVFEWSGDGRYAVLHDTRDRDASHIVSDIGEVHRIAPQRIQFLDRSGQTARTVETDAWSGRYIEVAGWPEHTPGIAVIHEYALDRSQTEAVKIDSVYSLLNVENGERAVLPRMPDFLASPQEAATYRIGDEWIVDEQMNYYRQ